MSKEFLEPVTNFKPEKEITTPFNRASRIWDNRIGEARVQAYNWRLFALGAMAVCIVLAIGLVIQSTKSTVKPYIVQVNSDGVAQTIGMAQEQKYVPHKSEIKYFLAQFVTKIRSMPLDLVLAKQHYSEAYAFLTQSAATQLQEYYAKEGDPSQLLGKQALSVTIKNVLPQTKDTYQILWTEDAYKLDGTLLDSYKMTGSFSIVIEEPKDEKDLYINPLGIYIRNFSWSRDLTK